eukprot:Lithocolla_globosa_v1_NODE_8288_length_838_cov_7.481481.p1 type:complete len:128 gc:universal NODE_8288_length_838_cov_7.481481:141-524(+)
MSGGIGLYIGNVRGAGVSIRSTNCLSRGLSPFLKTLESASQMVRQGSRAASVAIYISIFHDSVIELLRFKDPACDEEKRTPLLFYGLWVCDVLGKTSFQHTISAVPANRCTRSIPRIWWTGSEKKSF